MYPKIYLAMDNCVLYKRWTKPSEWAAVMADLGIRYVEASADTELDPLYMGKDYLYDWSGQVKDAEKKFGISVCNLYSGHGTYTTLGITHTDIRVREHMIKNWFFPMVKTAGEIGCGMGFFAHAFNHAVLQDNDVYEKYINILIDGLTRINQYAQEVHCGNLCIEQMYTPHQYPWKIKDTEHLLLEVTKKSGSDFYFSEDVGHHHIKFMRPKQSDIGTKGIWWGTDYAFRLAEEEGISAWEKIESNMNMNPHLFSQEEDNDCYKMLKTLGCYSPIIHLQQTEGTTSAHIPFTEIENKKGKIKGIDVLKALKEAYDTPGREGMPKKVNEIYLTLEIFSGTTSIMHYVLEDLRESVQYWRRFVPEDGLTLDELVGRLES